MVSSEETAAASTSGRDWLDEAMRTDASLMFLPGQVRPREQRQGPGTRESQIPAAGDAVSLVSSSAMLRTHYLSSESIVQASLLLIVSWLSPRSVRLHIRRCSKWFYVSQWVEDRRKNCNGRNPLSVQVLIR